MALWLLEQEGSGWWEKGADYYFDKIRDADVVWGYSRHQIGVWRHRVRPAKGLERFYHVPWWHTLNWGVYDMRSHPPPLAWEARPTGVLLFGAMSDRRWGFIREARRLGVPLSVREKMWGDAYFDVLRGTRVVVNVHQYERAVLEVHRIDALLALGLTVVSEPSEDPQIDAVYSPVVYFVPLEEMAKFLHHADVMSSRRRAP